MERKFRSLFDKKTEKEENGILYFGNENHGDYFEQSDIDDWRNGRLDLNWKKKQVLDNPVSKYLINEIISNNEYVIDLACGPSMGLIPAIKQLNPLFPCMATDANSHVLNEWKRYLEDNEICRNIDFAQFSAFEIPIKNDTVQAYSSYIGISSTRDGENGYASVLSEIHRTLDKEGRLYAIENEWSDIPTILGLFDKMKQEPWDCFLEKQISWHDRFIEKGFDIIYEEICDYRKLRADDNELGEAAARFGVDVGLKFIAYIVQKR